MHRRLALSLSAGLVAALATPTAIAQAEPPPLQPKPIVIDELVRKPPPKPAPAPAATIDIPFEKYRLDNGLTVILSPSKTVPMVVVDTIVRVGSRFERKGRTGFAHLFEHLMFMGTARVPTGDFDRWMEAEGAANNAWTSEDRTNYFDFGPSHALPLMLWLEADRFSALGENMTLERLNAQREVVRNERRQTSENQPYGSSELRLPELLYPEGHPYHHPIIGSHADLEAATVPDVQDFFSTHYVPSNMSLVVAGDFDVDATKALIEKWFSLVPAKEAPADPSAGAAEATSIPRIGKVVRETLTEKNIQLSKLIFAWHSPKRFAPGDAELDLLSNVLVRGKTSRLYQALVFEKELAQTVSAHQASADLSSVFTIEVLARPGVSLDTLEVEIDKLVQAVVDKGPTDAEVERAKIDFETGFVLSLESLPERASSLAIYESFTGDPGFMSKDLARYRAVTTASVHAVAKQTLDLGSRVILKIEPAAKPAPSAGGAP